MFGIDWVYTQDYKFIFKFDVIIIQHFKYKQILLYLNMF
jgi:hypothetical protein